ncbi:hypothetical protein VA7868_03315 [Vibrio aerogenes CECT 7868]|uniref:DUF1266 domain-containing protein n=1 Tax=Vibrio aerogenes CECT 7868 TaxID=1216006 RepID=A0A1M5ZWV9_9VIBR|nr:DUF1266 domain-containing protein [Vibrio aerogenes]SHI28383.1 hypothetical protein VA7868_03315 [Vibrio aerogenes CECT 7868]
MMKASPYYFDPDLLHCQWWLATTSPQISYNRPLLQYHLPAMSESLDKQEWLNNIDDSWGISDRKGLHQTIYSLVTAQTHGSIWQNELSLRACCSDREWAAHVNQKSMIHRGEMQFLDALYRHVGMSGFRGWDYCRGSYLTRFGLYTGWVTEEEFSFLLNYISTQIQRYFNNWQQYLQSFIFGRSYWQYLVDEDPDEDNLPYLLNDGFHLGVSRFFEQIEDDPDCPIPELPWNVTLPELDVPETLHRLLKEESERDQHQ